MIKSGVDVNYGECRGFLRLLAAALMMLLFADYVDAQLSVTILDARPQSDADFNEPLLYWLETLSSPRPLRVHVLTANLKNTSVEFDLLSGPDPDGKGPAHTALDDPLNLLAGTDALAAMNANACVVLGTQGSLSERMVWRRRQPVAILGWAQNQEGLVSLPKSSHPSFWIDRDGRGHIGSLLYPVSAGMAAAGVQRLLREGELAALSSSEPEARTALGLSANGWRVWWVVAEAGQAGRSGGFTQPELAGFLSKLGCGDAIEFDGGATSAMFLCKGRQNAKMTRVTARQPRPLPCLMVVRERSLKKNMPEPIKLIQPVERGGLIRP